VAIAFGQIQNPWAVRWDNSANGSDGLGPCQLAATRASGNLVITFDAPSTVDRLVIQAGVDHANPEWSELSTPSVVDLLFAEHQCVRIHLADEFTPQRFDMRVGRVSGVIVTVVQSDSPLTVDKGIVAITTIDFQHRR
jgi:hypothetical protein